MALTQFITLFQPTDDWTECHWETQQLSFTTSSWRVLVKYIFQHGWFGVRRCRSCQKYPRLHVWLAWAQVSHLSHSPMLCFSALYCSTIFTSALWDICWWTKVSMEVHDCYQLMQTAAHIEKERVQIFCVVLWSCLSRHLFLVCLNIYWIWDHYCTASMLGLQLGTRVKWQSSHLFPGLGEKLSPC